MVIKSFIRRLAARMGYSIRSIDRMDRVSGIEFGHDVKILLGGKPDPIVFDVGANEGQTIRMLRETFRSPRIYAFEPSPKTFKRLQSVYADPLITLENAALGDADATTAFHVTKNYSVNDSLLKPRWNEEVATVPVKVTTVDAYCRENKLESIDLLKIDTQGYDLHVLRGAAGMLAARKIRTVCAEMIFAPMYKEQPTCCDILSYVTGQGYRLLGFYEQTYDKNALIYCDACFLAP